MMAPVLGIILVLLCLPQYAFAASFEDFVNNLSTDLAPLIALFGEQVTKQFLSESTSPLDNIIFAIAPLGIITAVVSTIRTSRSLPLKAFIGRAQEGRGVAEAELLPCTSDTVSELWDDGGVSRVFGEPTILEIIKGSNEPGNISKPYGTSGIYQMKDVFLDSTARHREEVALLEHERPSSPESKDGMTESNSNTVWTVDHHSLKRLLMRRHDPDWEDPNGTQLTSRPNLALNVGRRPRPLWWNWFVLGFGLTIQSGVLFYGALATYWSRLREILSTSSNIPSWAYPTTCTGAILVAAGMYLCARLISDQTQEVIFKRNIDPTKAPTVCFKFDEQCGPTTRIKTGEIFWLQKEQAVGDQVFRAWVGRSHGSDNHVISARAAKGSSKVSISNQLLLYLALGLSITGFVLQFVGFRYLHPSVALANLGTTMVMSGLRATLRTQRAAAALNELSIFQTGSKGYELEHFARILANYDIRSFDLAPDSQNNDVIPLNTADILLRTFIELRQMPEVTLGFFNKEIGDTAIKLKSAVQALANFMSSDRQLGLNLENEFGYKEPLKVKIMRRKGYCQKSEEFFSLAWSPVRDRYEVHLGKYESPNQPRYEYVRLPLRRKIETNSWDIDSLELEALLAFLLSSRVAGRKHHTGSNRRIISFYDSSDKRAETRAWNEYMFWMTEEGTAQGQAFSPAVRIEKEPIPLAKDRPQPGSHGDSQRGLFQQYSTYFGWHTAGDALRLRNIASPFVLTRTTQASGLTMTAQDIFLAYLAQLCKKMRPARPTDIIFPDDYSESANFRFRSHMLANVSRIFVEHGLGSMGSALACVYPALKSSAQIPDLAEALPMLQHKFFHLCTSGSFFEATRMYTWLIMSYEPYADIFATELAAVVFHNVMVDRPESKIGGMMVDLSYIILSPPSIISIHVQRQIQWILEYLDYWPVESVYINEQIESELKNIKNKGYEPIDIGCESQSAEDWTVINRQRYTLICRFLSWQNKYCEFDSEGRSPLSWAAERGDDELVRWLSTWCPNALVPFRLDRPSDKSPLYYASANGHKSTQELILASLSSNNLYKLIHRDSSLARYQNSDSTVAWIEFERDREQLNPLLATIKSDHVVCLQNIICAYQRAFSTLRALIYYNREICSDSTSLHLCITHTATNSFKFLLQQLKSDSGTVVEDAPSLDHLLLKVRNKNGKSVIDLMVDRYEEYQEQLRRRRQEDLAGRSSTLSIYSHEESPLPIQIMALEVLLTIAGAELGSRYAHMDVRAIADAVKVGIDKGSYPYSRHTYSTYIAERVTTSDSDLLADRNEIETRLHRIIDLDSEVVSNNSRSAGNDDGDHSPGSDTDSTT